MIAAWGIYCITREAPLEHKGTFLVEPTVPVATTLAPAHLAAD